MRRALVLIAAVAACTGTADAAAPVRGGAFCWDFDLHGTDGPDRLEATAAAEHVATYDGDDVVLLFGGDDCAATGLGNDVVHLGPGDDEADGGRAADHLYGGPGNDVLVPGLGPDEADGGEGDDLIRDERGDTAPDVLTGGPGHDVIRAVDFAADVVSCGPGYDVAIVDAADTTTECERVELARRPRVTATALRTGVRPAFAVDWVRADLALPASIVLQRVGGPAARPGCDAGPWAASGAMRPRLRFRGRRGACPGEYAFTITYVADGAGGPRVACERLAGAPRAGCAPSERLGVVSVRVL